MHPQPPEALEFNYKLLHHRWMPVIPITLFSQNSKIISEAYVDSGAFYSVFDWGVVEGLGLNLKYAKKMIFVVGDGDRLITWLLKLPVQIGNQSFISEITFSEDLKVGFNLLGRKGVFNHFAQVAFDEKRKKVIFLSE